MSSKNQKLLSRSRLSSSELSPEDKAHKFQQITTFTRAVVDELHQRGVDSLSTDILQQMTGIVNGAVDSLPGIESDMDSSDELPDISHLLDGEISAFDSFTGVIKSGENGSFEAVSAAETLQQTINHQQKLIALAVSDELWRSTLPEFTPNPDAIDNPKIEVAYEEGFGRIIVANAAIKAGEVICTFDGPVFTAKNISELPNQYLIDHVIQIGPEEYMMESRGKAALVEHSCDPNCGIKGNPPQIFTLRDIAPGEKLSWDYRMSEDSNWSGIEECLCGAPDCGKFISGFSELSADKKQAYHQAGALSPWLIEKHQNNLVAETYTSNEITPERIQQLADILLEVFWIDWPEYAYCPDCDADSTHDIKKSAKEAYGRDDITFAEIWDDIVNKQQPVLPDCDCCSKPMELFLDPQGTINCLTKKFQGNQSYITLLKDGLGKPAGFNWVYYASLEQIFENEWQQFYSYVAPGSGPQLTRPFARFHQQVSKYASQHFDHPLPLDDNGLIDPETYFSCFNCLAILQKYRGQKGTNIIMRDLFRYIPESMLEPPCIGESILGDGVFIKETIVVPGVFTPEGVEPKLGDYVGILHEKTQAYKKRLAPPIKSQ